MTKISMNKKYRTAGSDIIDSQPVWLLTTQAPGYFPVVGIIGEDVYRWASDGTFAEAPGHLRQLVEVRSAEDVIASQLHNWSSQHDVERIAQALREAGLLVEEPHGEE